MPVASHWRRERWLKWCCGRTALHICSEVLKQDLIVNDFNTSPKQGLIAHDSRTSIKLDFTRLRLCIHVFITSHRAPRNARGVLIVVVSHLESTDPRLHCLSPMVLCSYAIRAASRSRKPLYNAIVARGVIGSQAWEWLRTGPTRRSSSTTSGSSFKIQYGRSSFCSLRLL